MNDLLQLKGHFESRKNSQSFGARKLPGNDINESVSLEKLNLLINQIQTVINFWSSDTLLNDKLLTVYYNKIVAKSNRIQELFHPHKNTIVGAKFTETNPIKHIITYCLSIEEMKSASDKLKLCTEIMKNMGWNKITNDTLTKINLKKIKIGSAISKTSFIGCIVDSYYIERIDIDAERKTYEEPTIVTLYDTGKTAKEILQNLNIDYRRGKIIDDYTLYLTAAQYAELKAKAPYLIAMSVKDISTLTPEEFISKDFITERTIRLPKGEPIIGVIDTGFDESVYFSPWVDFKDMLSPEIPHTVNDTLHGTYVSSIIVDGPSLNPELDDGCGHFKVRHFGVGTANGFSAYTLLNCIEEIVANNTEIKVWNLSLGSMFEIEKNFISPVAYLLDKLQYKYDIIFVVAGTNKNKELNQTFIGSPADSINSLVVNSVDFSKAPASYSRRGPVLSFYKKPDVSYYGGDKDKELTVYNGLKGDVKNTGTSFAAPWISRKLAYLIHIMGMTREAAKALIIDSAIQWNKNDNINDTIGYGVVPIKISDIIQSQNDEIKFVINGICDNYKTYNNTIPVPMEKGFFPFIAKATLCYFPDCSRNQGVDYTNTELNMQFGRVSESGIESINNDLQDAKNTAWTTEENARDDYRKWDNVKIIRESLKKRLIPKKNFNSNYWGICLTSKERTNTGSRPKVRFGIVITLKEMNGINRIEEFIQRCTFSQWIVNRITIENKLDVYAKADTDLTFE